MTEKSYFLGTHEAELKRLDFQSAAWRHPTQELWRNAGISTGHRVLDLGCGPGFCTVELSKLVGRQGRVISIDKSAAFLDVLRQRLQSENILNVDVIELDIDHDRLDIEPVDVVFVRWMHQYVDNLDHVLSEEIRCLRKGGVLATHEVFHYGGVSISPFAEIFKHVTDQIVSYYARNHRDINVGGRIPALVAAKGLKVRSITSSFPLARSDEPLWEWYKQFSLSMVERLAAEAVLTDFEARAYRQMWSDWAAIPGAFISTPAKVQMIAVK
jgi:ubiquinone/menaquinone biosynthesis C-methylase UbiE